MRQFVCPAAPNSKGLLEITGKDFHYLRKVLRMAPGDMITLSLPGGGRQEATICKADDAAKKIILQVCSSQGGNQSRAGNGGSGKNLSQAQDCGASSDGQKASQAQNVRASRTPLSLLQFIPKPQKMELIVRQMTECGVANIVPVIGEYTQAGSEKALQKSDRFERIVREARQQSGSQVETKIHAPQKLSAALDMIESGDLSQAQEAAGSFGHEQNSSQGQGVSADSLSQPTDCGPVAKLFFYERIDKTVPLSAAFFGREQNCPQAQEAAAGNLGFAGNFGSAAPSSGLASDCGAGSLGLANYSAAKPRACVFAVGSEGGISPAEAELLLERGFKAVHFNTNILRCETAALYAAAAIQSALDN